LDEWAHQRRSLWDFNLLLTNNRGHGNSTLGVTSSSRYLYDCAEDNVRIAQHLGITRPDVVAFSMGALLATEYATQLRGCIRSMTYVAPAVSNPLKTFALGAAAEKMLSALEALVSHDSFVTLMKGLSQIAKSDTTLYPWYKLFRHVTHSRASYSQFRRYLHSSFEIDPRIALLVFKSMVEKGDEIGNKMGLIRAPVMVVRGEKDMFVEDMSLDTIYRHFAYVDLYVLSNATHYPHAEKPREFNRLLYDFLIQH
jgi:esterase